MVNYMRYGPLLLMVFALNACTTVSVDDYADSEPLFVPESFFSGSLTAYGVVKNYKGFASRSFAADITACWQDGVGTLDERFIFDDGEKQTRVWTLEKNLDGSYNATAGDVRGVGRARVAGNAMFLDYVLTIQLSDSRIDVAVDDRMYLVSEDVLINESTLTKLGLPVGGIVLTIIRHPEVSVACPAV